MILEFSIENTYSIKDRQTISFEAVGDSDDQHIINVGNKKFLNLPLFDEIISLGELTLFDHTQNMLFNEQIEMYDINRLIDKAGIDHMYGTLIRNRTLPKDEKAAA
jgi:hypothetical protein